MYQHKNGGRLRKVEVTDLPSLLELKGESWWGTHTTPILNSDDQVKWFENMPANLYCLILEIADVPVGVTIISDIDWIARTAKISGSIYKKNRIDSIIKTCCEIGVDFAFEILNLRRLDAEVLISNYTAQRYEIGYLGFVVEGRRREAVYKAGIYYDSLVLGLLRTEWANQERILAYHGSCNQVVDHDLACHLIKRSEKYILKETH